MVRGGEPCQFAAAPLPSVPPPRCPRPVASSRWLFAAAPLPATSQHGAPAISISATAPWPAISPTRRRGQQYPSTAPQPQHLSTVPRPQHLPDGTPPRRPTAKNTSASAPLPATSQHGAPAATSQHGTQAATSSRWHSATAPHCQEPLRISAPASNKPHPAEKSTPVWLAIWRIWAGFANSQLLHAAFATPNNICTYSSLLLPWAAAQT